MTERTNQAIDRLAAALTELSYRGRISITPDARILLCPGQPRPEDARHLHAIGLSADVVDLLAAAVEQLLTAPGSEDPHAASNPYYAHIFALAKPDLAADIDSAFTDLDLTELTRTVLDDTDPIDRTSVTRALNAMFGHVTDQEAEDDK